MYKTEREIFGQSTALEETYKYFKDNQAKIESFSAERKFGSITFIGSGSSFSLCQSAEMSAKIRMRIPANSLAAGDLLLNFPDYSGLLKDTLLVAPSRSGSTSEVVLSVQEAKERFGIPCISISAREGSELAEIVDLSLELPWAFDDSVCQTRTVTNLYLANLLLIGILAGEQELLAEIKKAVFQQSELISEYKDRLEEISQTKTEWKRVVVLADSELQGVGSEGALAFKEICQVPSNYYHLLDVRHGPMVLIDESTLVIAALSPNKLSYQQDLIDDLKAKGAIVITVGGKEEDLDSDLHVAIPDYKFFGVKGIPFIFVPQAIAFFKAMKEGINPDIPTGLDPWIKL